MEKDRVKLPLIRPTVSQTAGQTVGANIIEQKVFSVDLEIPSHKSRTKATPLQDKQTYWSSSQIPRKREDNERTRSFERRLKTLETSSKSSSSDCYAQTPFAVPLRRHYSEPLLQEHYNPFSVRATSLKLNEREKEKDNTKKTFTDLLPSVFFDTRLSSDNHKTNTSLSGPLQAGTKSDEKNRPNATKINAKEEPNQSKDHQMVYSSRKLRRNKSTQDKDVDFARKKLLPKRRLSDQIDSNYEINSNKNDKQFPRRITIRTSQSCPTIVIHECGEEDEAADTTINDSETNISSNQINGSISLKKDTTSFVSCWKPKQSVVNEK